MSVYESVRPLAEKTSSAIILTPASQQLASKLLELAMLLGLQVISRDHNTKRAKLSIDVCAMFVAAKTIFSNFAITRARAQTIEFDF